MTRGHIIALVILVLVAAVVVMGMGSCEKLWLGWTYKEERSSFGQVTLPHGAIIGFATVHRAIVLRKRYGWLPGEKFIVPDQVCPGCQGAHQFCFPEGASRASYRLTDGALVDLPSSFRCTCTHPSHAQESE